MLVVDILIHYFHFMKGGKQLMGIKMTVFQMSLSDRQQAPSSALSAVGVTLLWCNSVAYVNTSVILCSVCSLYGFTPSRKWTEYGKKSSQLLYNEVVQMFATTVNCHGLWCFLPLCLNVSHKYSSFGLHTVQVKKDISNCTLPSLLKSEKHFISWDDLLVDIWKGCLPKFSLLLFNHLRGLLVHCYPTCKTHTGFSWLVSSQKCNDVFMDLKPVLFKSCR